MLRDVGAFEYDAVVAVGLAACLLSPNQVPNDFGTQLFESKAALAFDGLSGAVGFDAEGDRNVSSANVHLLHHVMDAEGSFRAKTSSVFTERAWAWTFWEAEVPLPAAGAASLVCKATDAAHNVQVARWVTGRHHVHT